MNMDLSAILSSIHDILWTIPIYAPIISFSIILLTYLLNKDRLWTVPKLAFLFAIIITIYDIVAKTPGDNVLVQFQNYINETKYNYNFLHVYIPIFLYCILIAFIFSYAEKIRNKISVKSSNLPK
ncbi:MAG: hypothetical protein Q8942_09840 [Bacillota bacterium]|nr:hypothetical protein [Bacillota bacterium]